MIAFGPDASSTSAATTSTPASAAAGLPAANAPIFDPKARDFLERLDADAASLIAVKFHGRWSIMDTLAREQLQQMYGRQTIEGLQPALAYLEIYGNAGQYLDKPLIYVKDANLRQVLAQALPDGWRERFMASGWRLPPACFVSDDERRDLLAAGRAIQADYNRVASVPNLLPVVCRLENESRLKASRDRLAEAFSSFMAVRAIEMPAYAWGIFGPLTAPGSGVDHPQRGAGSPSDAPWQSRNAAAVKNVLKVAKTSGQEWRFDRLDRLELFYNRAYKATIAWIGFSLATLIMLAAAVTKKLWLRRLGLSVFWLATVVLACGFAARWIISGRVWYLPPIMNTFEAVTASALLAAVLALVIEARWPRNILAVAAGFYGTAALLACWLWSSQIGADITPAHGILYSPLLALHVAIIIIGHAMAGMTLIISLIYIVRWAVGRTRRRGDTETRREVASETRRQEDGDGPALAAIDRCNLIVAQIAAWAIALGTALGAYWGDRAWGHWWSWDIKETWALVNVVIFIVVLHVRYVVPPRWRGLATAGLCIVGCGVMLFNWIAVNYLFHGMHSYT
jgi:ABC-type transport system involved in cytochrome c biogenesis permease subunit